MDIFSKLNDQGTTVIVVTHERDIAAQTKRTIEMKDGYIDRDIKTVEILT
jgi:putative ABC transport system ATP-binding protein